MVQNLALKLQMNVLPVKARQVSVQHIVVAFLTNIGAERVELGGVHVTEKVAVKVIKKVGQAVVASKGGHAVHHHKCFLSEPGFLNLRFSFHLLII